MSYKDPEKKRQYNREYSRRWRAKNKDKTRQYAETYKARHPQKHTCRYRHNNWKRSGIDIVAAERMLAKHNNGHCQICGEREPGGAGTWHVDHDHVTGRLRGVLCSNCNRALGYFQDNIAVLEAAVRYLKAFDA